MKTIKDMNVRERKVLNSIYNGWFMSGTYRALLDNHSRVFEADSPGMLFKEVDKWFASHEANHTESHLLVKCVEVG